MRVFISAALIAVLGACASGSGGRIPVAQLGTYQFRENVPTSPPVLLEGVVRVRPDTIIVEVASGFCRHDLRRQTPRSITYECSNATITVDRNAPATRTYYSVPTTVRVSERVCVEWVRNAQGVQTCARWRTEYHERESRRGGRLTLMRA